MSCVVSHLPKRVRSGESLPQFHASEIAATRRAIVPEKPFTADSKSLVPYRAEQSILMTRYNSNGAISPNIKNIPTSVSMMSLYNKHTLQPLEPHSARYRWSFSSHCMVESVNAANHGLSGTACGSYTSISTSVAPHRLCEPCKYEYGVYQEDREYEKSDG